MKLEPALAAAAAARGLVQVAPAPVLEPVSCALCGQAQDDELYPALAPSRNVSPAFAASLGVRGATRIVRCRACDLCYVSPRHDASYILEAYREAHDELYVCQADARRRSFNRNLEMVSRYLRPARLLDVGCAAGYFLDVAHDGGWDAWGVEPNREFVRLARMRHGDRVREGTLVEAELPAGFDAITMWDVLEHSTDPRRELKRAYQLLRPGGLLFVNFPNIGGVLARATGARWWFLLSHHLYYFTPATLSRLLESEGFGVIARGLYRQTLELGYLAGMSRLYSEGLARRLEGLMDRLRLSSLPISYYAGQVTLVAAR